jgi:NAD(P)-dependent dehydrogenase (short-subunit alcohol dehydrogenase family)
MLHAVLLDRLYRVNLVAPALLACAVAAQPDVADAAVVTILDQKVANLNPDFFSYSCSKIALEAATRMLAQALGPRVRVNAVSPGLTLPSGDQTAAEFARAGSKNLLGRPVGADAVADAVAFLLGSRGVTGQNLFVDCGQRFLPRGGDVMFEDRETAVG